MLDGGGASAYVSHLVLRGTYLPDTVRCTIGDRFRPPSYVRDDFDYSVNPRAFKCYVDVRANSYLLGEGPSNLTVLTLRYIYWDGEYAPGVAEGGRTEQEIIEEVRQEFETGLGKILSGREEMLLVGPAVDVSVEAWRVFTTWDVQRREDDVVGRRPSRKGPVEPSQAR